jgi:hypothetical protein
MVRKFELISHIYGIEKSYKWAGNKCFPPSDDDDDDDNFNSFHSQAIEHSFLIGI